MRFFLYKGFCWKVVVCTLLNLIFLTLHIVWEGGHAPIILHLGNLRTTCAIIMKLWTTEKKLLTNILSRTTLTLTLSMRKRPTSGTVRIYRLIFTWKNKDLESRGDISLNPSPVTPLNKKEVHQQPFYNLCRCQEKCFLLCKTQMGNMKVMTT